MAQKNLESDFRKNIRESFKLICDIRPEVKWHLSWIESHETSPGIPDIEYCVKTPHQIGGVVGNIELKALGDNMEVRPSQLKWFRERMAAGGNPLILVKVYIDSPRKFLMKKSDTEVHELYPGTYLIPGSKIETLHNNPNAFGIWKCGGVTVDILSLVDAMLSPWVIYGR